MRSTVSPLAARAALSSRATSPASRRYPDRPEHLAQDFRCLGHIRHWRDHANAVYSLQTTLAIRNGHQAPPSGTRPGRLLAAGALSVIGSASSTSAAIVLTDDNRYVVTDRK